MDLHVHVHVHVLGFKNGCMCNRIGYNFVFHLKASVITYVHVY